MNDFLNFVLNFGFNFVVAFVIVRFIYYPLKHNKNYVFTFLAFNTVIYFVLSLLTSVDLSIGVGFGLFAIFSVLRYRTDPMPTREMTYLFVIIALPVMNSVLLTGGSYTQLATANALVVIVLYMLEQGWGFHYDTSKRITYERIDLIRPENQEQLLADLQQRTGLTITRVEVGRINFLRDTADLKIYYIEPNGFSDEFEAYEDVLMADA
ncbi:MAG: DUF4956 domain-containing protein [Caldilineaceae bacterium]|nr:DUF4956 domain-containing protein [Caldilineaceae bacterium]